MWQILSVIIDSSTLHWESYGRELDTVVLQKLCWQLKMPALLFWIFWFHFCTVGRSGNMSFIPFTVCVSDQSQFLMWQIMCNILTYCSSGLIVAVCFFFSWQNDVCDAWPWHHHYHQQCKQRARLQRVWEQRVRAAMQPESSYPERSHQHLSGVHLSSTSGRLQGGDQQRNRYWHFLIVCLF